MTDTIEARVDRGVALLDRTLADWDQRIDLDRLDLRDTCNCILGQEFAGHDDEVLAPYHVGRFELFADESNAYQAAIDHGFDATRGREYDELTAEWKRVILARRAVTR